MTSLLFSALLRFFRSPSRLRSGHNAHSQKFRSCRVSKNILLSGSVIDDMSVIVVKDNAHSDSAKPPPGKQNDLPLL